VRGHIVIIREIGVAKYFSSMADVDETAKLWKVNRTIHELVKDRVSCD
jgi:hypothetical protein